MAYLLTEAEVASGRAGKLAPAQRERLDQLPDRLSQADALSQLLESFDQSAHLPPRRGPHRVVRRASAARARDGLRVAATHSRHARPRRCSSRRRRGSRPPTHRSLSDSSAAPIRRSRWRRFVAPVRVRSPAAVTSLVRRLGDADAGDATRGRAVAGRDRVGRRHAGARAGDRRRRPRRARRGRPGAGDTRVPSRAAARSRRPSRRKRSGRRISPRRWRCSKHTACCAARPASRCSTASSTARGFLGKRDDSETRACAAMALGQDRDGSGARVTAAGPQREGSRGAQRREQGAARRGGGMSIPADRHGRRRARAVRSPSHRRMREAPRRDTQPASQRGGLRRRGPRGSVARSCCAFYGAMRAIKLYPARERRRRQSARRSHGTRRRALIAAGAGARVPDERRVHFHQRDATASRSRQLRELQPPPDVCSGAAASDPLRVTETVTPRDWLVVPLAGSGAGEGEPEDRFEQLTGKLTMANVHSLELGPPSPGARRSATGNSPRKPPSGPTRNRSPSPRKSCTPFAWGARPTSRSSSASCRRSSTRS